MKKNKTNQDIKSGLENSPLHLLHRVLQIALDIYNLETGEGALTQRQFALLKAINDYRGEGEGLTQTDLVKLTGIDRSTLADMVARMTAKGLLLREKSALDARANLVTLSKTACEILDEITPKVLIADDKILEFLSPPKRESFVKLLRKIAYARDGEACDEDEPVEKKKKPKADKAPLEPLVLINDKKKKLKKSFKLSKKDKMRLMPKFSNGAKEES